MQIRNLMKPSRLLLAIFLLQFGCYFLYAIGVIKSYRISFVTTNILGIVCLITYYLYQVIVFRVAEKGGLTIENRHLQCINIKRIRIISCICMAIAFGGFLRLTVNLINRYNITTLLHMILRNRQIGALVYGGGNTILCNFAIVSLMLLTLIINKQDKISCILWIINFIFLIVYASFLSSRILILQGTLFIIVILARRFSYGQKVSCRLILLVLFVVCFFVITSGFRDYDQAGYKYTNSKINWGVSRNFDYFISTFNTSVEIDTFTTGKTSSFPTNSIEIISKFLNKEVEYGETNVLWRQEVSAIEYTNIGAFAQIYSDWRFLFLIPVFIVSILCLKAWRLYDQGSLWGYMLWPIMLYNILETWRINYLGTAMAEVLLIICCIICFICRKCFIET